MELKTQALLEERNKQRREAADREIQSRHQQRLDELESQARASANELKQLRDVVARMALALSNGIDVRVATDVSATVDADDLAQTIAKAVSDTLAPVRMPSGGPHSFRVERNGDGNITAIVRE